MKRAQVVRGLGEGGIRDQRHLVVAPRVLVASHPVLEQAEVVPRGSVGRGEGRDALVGVHRLGPPGRIPVQLARQLEPALRLAAGRGEGPHEATERRIARLLGEPLLRELHHDLAGRLEKAGVALDEDLAIPDRDPQLGERSLGCRRLPPERSERPPDLANRRPLVEERPGDPQRHQIPERVLVRAVRRVEQLEPPQLVGPSGGQGQEPDDVPLREDPAGRRQCLKWRIPVVTMAMPCSSAAATISSSRIEPPGWMTAVLPASATTSSPSRNGKNASEAAAAPASL